jgi:hypothetical protein
MTKVRTLRRRLVVSLLFQLGVLPLEQSLNGTVWPGLSIPGFISELRDTGLLVSTAPRWANRAKRTLLRGCIVLPNMGSRQWFARPTGP